LTVSSAPPAPGESRAALVVVVGTVLLDMLVYGLVVPVIPAYSARLGASPAEVGLLFATYGIALLGATPLTVALSSRVARRSMLVGGLLSLALATGVFAMSTSFGALMIARVVQGASAAASWTAGLALLADLYPRAERGQALGTATTASSIGTLLGPPFGGWLADRWGFASPFLVVAGGATVMAVVALVVLGRKATPAAGGRRHPASLVPPPPSAPPETLFRDAEVRANCAFVALGAGILGVVEPMLPLDLAARLHATPTEIGLLFATSTLVYGAVAPLVGRLGDLPRRRVKSADGARRMIAGGLLSAAALPALALPPTMLLQVVGMALFGGALTLMLTPSLRGLASAVDRVGGDYGVVYSFYNAAYAVGLMVGAGVGGRLVSAYGVSRGLLVAGIVVVVLGIKPAWTLSRGTA